MIQILGIIFKEHMLQVSEIVELVSHILYFSQHHIFLFQSIPLFKNSLIG